MTDYHATCWAEGKTAEEIKCEIADCTKRYYKPYLWNEVGNAHRTSNRIDTLKQILQERLSPKS